MSSGHFALSATITTWKKLAKFMPEEAKAFWSVLKKAHVKMEEWHEREQICDDGEISQEKWAVIDAAWEIFSKRFEEQTDVYGQHLSLTPRWRHLDDTEPYDTDETRGAFFEVDNVYHKTGTALRHHELLIDAHWADFG